MLLARGKEDSGVSNYEFFEIARAGIVVYLANGNLRGITIYPILYESFMGNLALRIFTLSSYWAASSAQQRGVKTLYDQ